MGKAIYAIDAFPEDDQRWRIDWVGGVRGALLKTEKANILKARLALRMFERAMGNFTAQLSHTTNESESFVDPECQRQAVSGRWWRRVSLLAHS